MEHGIPDKIINGVWSYSRKNAILRFYFCTEGKHLQRILVEADSNSSFTSDNSCLYCNEHNRSQEIDPVSRRLYYDPFDKKIAPIKLIEDTVSAENIRTELVKIKQNSAEKR